MRNFLRLENLSKSYVDGLNRKRVVLDHANATFDAGNIVAILGKSGSGKSTLLNLISGIDKPDSGKILLFDQEISSYSDRQLTELRRTKIGFVFQFFNLLPTLTVWENVILPLELQGSKNGKLAFARYLLEAVGMVERAKEFPDRLSGGEQQRVAIARALAHSPDLVLADEPTGNLDSANGKLVMELLAELTRENGHNLILVTHSKEAAEYADQVYHIRAGKICYSCETDEGEDR